MALPKECTSLLAGFTRRNLYHAIPAVESAHPVWGCLPEISEDMLQFTVEVAKQHPDLAYFHVAHLPFVQTTDPELIKQILTSEAESTTSLVFPVTMMRHSLGEGVLFSEGEKWKSHRRLIKPHFYHENLNGISPAISHAIDTVQPFFKASADSQQPFPIEPLMSSITLEGITDSLFGTSLSKEQRQRILSFTKEYNQQLTDGMMGSPLTLINMVMNNRWDPKVRSLHAIVNKADTVFHQEIDKHEQLPPEQRPNDLVSALLMSSDYTGEPMSRRQILNEVRSLIMAGHDPIAKGLTWLWYELSQHPEVVEKLREELALQGITAVPALPDLPRLPYLKAVIEESLRLHPANWVMIRMATKDFTITQSESKTTYVIPQGTNLIISQYATHRHPHYWEEPNVFNPERFLGEHRKKIHPYAYMPFGGGPRFCIGNQFSLAEMQMITASLVPAYDFSLVGPPENVHPVGSVSLNTKELLMMRVQKRNQG